MFFPQNLNIPFFSQTKQLDKASPINSWIDAHKLLRRFGLSSGEAFIQVECGNEHFVRAASKVVGMNGTVYAVDCNQENIDYLRKKLTALQEQNITVRYSELYPLRLKSGIGNFLLLACVLHKIEHPSILLTEIKRILEPCGSLVIIESEADRRIWRRWKPQRVGEELSFLSIDQTKNILKKAGFYIICTSEIERNFYAVKAAPVKS